MSSPADRSPPPDLAADDPRISEWLDGRLPAAEAADVERAVAASPSLAGLVADLRAIRRAAKLLPTLGSPAGFTDRVMQAVSASGPSEAGDRAVTEEWQAIEAERIAEERAEAAADLDASRPAGGRWPWLALACALAAGVLVAVVLNPPPDGNRDVAVLAPAPVERAGDRDGASGPAVVEARSDRGDRAEVEPQPAGDVLASRDPAAEENAAADRPTAGEEAEAALELAARREQVSARSGRIGAGSGSGNGAGPSAARSAAVPMPAAEGPLGVAAESSGPAPGLAKRGRLATGEPDPIEVIVQGPAGRAELEAKIVAFGLVAAGRPQPPADGGVREESHDPERLSQGGDGQGRSLRKTDDILELTGPAEAIDALLESVAGRGEPPTAATAKAVQAAPGEGGGLREATGRGRVLIRVVERPVEGGKSQP